MRTLRKYLGAAGLAGALALAACGGGEKPVASLDRGIGPQAATWTEGRSPHLWIDNMTHIGGGVIEGLGGKRTRSSAGHHGETLLWHGRITNGIDRSALASYLAADARLTGGVLQRFGDTPPVVRVARGTSDEHFWDVQTAVMLINDSLPRHWQLQLSDDDAFAPIRANSEPTEGEILIVFAPRARWAVSGCEKAIGCADAWSYSSGEMSGANIWVDHTALSEHKQMLGTIIHEILHALGREHPDPYEFRETIMKVPGYKNSGFVLYQLDRDALFAVYDRLEVGTLPSAIYSGLAPWDDTSDVVVGGLSVPGAQIIFGSVHRNGLIQPFASGETPGIWLEENRALRGTARWSGRLLGFTPRTEVVAGGADMTVRLASLKGDIRFTGLEKWRARAAPGAIGTGTRWGDGNLHYPIEVYGSDFWRLYDSGDEGDVSGSFFGPAHEGMGGTIRRDDLIGAFGGER